MSNSGADCASREVATDSILAELESPYVASALGTNELVDLDTSISGFEGEVHGTSLLNEALEGYICC